MTGFCIHVCACGGCVAVNLQANLLDVLFCVHVIHFGMES